MGDAAIGDIGSRLAAHGRIRLDVPGGELHIDRHLPFLLLYRRPPNPDAGTAELLVGEAAWLVIDGDRELELGAVLSEVVGAQGAGFGGFLVAEIWTAPTSGPDSSRQFRIIAPIHGAPTTTLEELETALLSTSPADRPAEVRIEYADRWAPPGLPLIAGDATFCHIGVEVPPIYRDDVSGDVDPTELRSMRRDIGRALRRGLYAFAHDQTSLRPAHFQELGPQAMSELVYDIDRRIDAISSAFDLILHVTPVNTAAAQREFASSPHSQPPEFLYRSRTFDPDLVKRALYALPIEQIEDPALAHLFIDKRRELDNQLTLVSDRNTSRFLSGSRAIYGDPEPALLDLARQLLDDIDVAGSPEHLVPVEVLAARAREELSYYRNLDPTLEGDVEIREDVAGVMVAQGNLLVGRDARIPERRIEALLAHELGTHVLTHHNGRQQPFRELHAGLAGYEALQEGLAVLWEYLVGGLDRARVRLLAARVVAVAAVSDGAEFLETYRLLRDRWGYNDRGAFGVAMRVHRGGGFTKDVVYLRGLSQVLDYLGEGHSFERLHLGKVSHEHLEIVEELHWRKVLIRPRLLPRYLETAAVVERLDRCREGISVLDLATEATT